MYESIARGAVISDDDLRVEVLVRHQGDVGQFICGYDRLAAHAVQQGRRGIRDLAPDLLKLISEPKVLRAAWDHNALKGGEAPGHDGRRYSDYSNSEVWALCRALCAAIRDGRYQPQRERIVWHDKTSGTGKRPIVLLALPDRVVQRAITMILQPLLDPYFDPHSFGYRPKKGHLRALATAECLARNDHLVWVTHDIKSAFEHVSIPRLMDVLRGYFPDDDLLGFLQRALTSRRFKGLRQGGSASPVMLNLYLDHFLDRRWRRSHPRIPLLRFADDILILCYSADEALTVDSELRRILRPTGMKLKASVAEAIHDLAAGDHATWLGFQISKSGMRFAKQLTDRSWAKLRKNLELAHKKTGSQLRAEQTIESWLKARGPAYGWSLREQVCQRVFRTARRYGFEEIPCRDELIDVWQAGYAHWRTLRKKIKHELKE
jgi:hypothetical protein